MPYTSTRSYPSRTRTTTTRYETVLIRPSSEEPVKVTERNTIRIQPKTEPTVHRSQPRTQQPPVGSGLAKKPSHVASPPPKDTTSKTQSYENDIPPEIQLAEAESGLQIIRIPCDDTAIRATTVPLDHISTSLKKCIPMEKSLGLYPDMWGLNNHTFDWHYRQLLCLSADEMSDSADINYLLYMCDEKQARLPHNRYLEKLSKAKWYGDGFLFKMYKKDCDLREGPSFLHMGQDSISHLDKGGITKDKLRELLAVIRKDMVWKEGVKNEVVQSA